MCCFMLSLLLFENSYSCVAIVHMLMKRMFRELREFENEKHFYECMLFVLVFINLYEYERAHTQSYVIHFVFHFESQLKSV